MLLTELAPLAADLTEKAVADGIDQLAVGAAVVVDGKLLIVTRSDDEETFPRCAELPGGSVEPGEELPTALARELLEETGLGIVSVPEYLGSFDFELRDGRRVRQFNFLVEPDSADVRLNPVEHSDFRWLDPADAPSIAATPATPLMLECVTGICARILAR